mmetsp:Transcript_9931/g.22842  ORF Transcript_9931/g.22842 Transcript_9931/m.22842 type:complete len:338 (-) Transcript_9931:923-1936(-)
MVRGRARDWVGHGVDHFLDHDVLALEALSHRLIDFSLAVQPTPLHVRSPDHPGVERVRLQCGHDGKAELSCPVRPHLKQEPMPEGEGVGKVRESELRSAVVGDRLSEGPVPRRHGPLTEYTQRASVVAKRCSLGTLCSRLLLVFCTTFCLCAPSANDLTHSATHELELHGLDLPPLLLGDDSVVVEDLELHLQQVARHHLEDIPCGGLESHALLGPHTELAEGFAWEGVLPLLTRMHHQGTTPLPHYSLVGPGRERSVGVKLGPDKDTTRRPALSVFGESRVLEPVLEAPNAHGLLVNFLHAANRLVIAVPVIQRQAHVALGLEVSDILKVLDDFVQ